MKMPRRVVLALIVLPLPVCLAYALPQQSTEKVSTSSVSSVAAKADSAELPAAKREAKSATAKADYDKLPLSFEANTGQTDSRVQFLSRGSGYSLFLTDHEAVIALRKPGSPKYPAKKPVGPRAGDKPVAESTIRMQLAGTSTALRASGMDELPGKANYFIGNDPTKWRTNVPTYAKVKYEDVYPGVDLVYYGNQGQLEYDFVLAPGANPNEIRLKFSGQGKLRVDRNGDLLLGSKSEEVRFKKPVVYQKVAGKKKLVEGNYLLTSAGRIGFQLGEYNRSEPLIIDPILAYSTYLGGMGLDNGTGIAVDASGNAYVAGLTGSADFPVSNALQSTIAGASNAFVTKLSSSGSALFSTYLGGNNRDQAFAIALDASGNAYVAGATTSSNFPTVNALQPALGGSNVRNAFVSELNPSGSALVYSTYLGGGTYDVAVGIAVDSFGNASVAGYTQSSNFPAINALQSSLGGFQNAFVTKIAEGGSALVYSTYLGGNNFDQAGGIAVDSSGNAYVTGLTESDNFPIANALQATNPSPYGSAFVTKFNPTGTQLIYSTYFGGSGNNASEQGEYGYGIAVDSFGDAYVVGSAASNNLPTVNPLQPTIAGENNVFIAKFNPAGSALLYSTFLGGNTYDSGNAIAVDAAGNAYVTGYTSSADFPTLNAFQPTYISTGGTNVFVSEINANGSALVYSSFLAGNCPFCNQYGNAIAVDASGNTYLTGYTGSTSFPTVNPLQSAYGGGIFDGFVAKIVSVGDFTGSLTPYTANLVEGESTTFTLSLTPLNGFTGDVSLSVSGLPPGTTGSWSPAIVGGSGTSVLTINVGATTPGTYTLTLTGANGTITHSTTAALTVTAPVGDFIGSVSPYSQSVVIGNTTSFGVNLTPLSGFNSNVTMGVSGLPPGATASWSPMVVPGGSGATTLTIATTTATPAGFYNVTLTGTAGPITHTTTVGLTVSAPVGDFIGSLTPISQSVQAGSSTTFGLSLSPIGGFTGNVNLSVSRLPLGATASWSSDIVTGGSGTSILTINIPAYIPAGTYSITLTGTSSTITHSTNPTLVVTPPPAS